MRTLPTVLSLSLLGSLVLLAGCQTYERTSRAGNEELILLDKDGDYMDKTEEDLVEITEDHPDNPKAHWMLGNYYERLGRYIDALASYERMQVCTVEFEKKAGRRFTHGLYLLGKMHALLKNWTDSVRYLRSVLALQPKDPDVAVLNKDFMETHYLLGAIYFEHRQWAQAEKHLVTFKELSGDHRADGMLIRIEDEIHPEDRPRGWYPGDPLDASSQEPKKTSETEPAGKAAPAPAK